MSPCSFGTTFRQHVGWLEHRQAKTVRRRREVSDIVSYQRIRARVDLSFKNKFISCIGKLRTPEKMRLDRLRQSCQFRQNTVQLHGRKSMNSNLVRPLEHRLIFKEQRDRD